MFNYKTERLNPKELLGQGSFGKVYPYQMNQDDKDDKYWAVKVIYAKDEDSLFEVFQEIVIGFSCDHPGIVPIKGYHIKKVDDHDYKVYLKIPRMVETLKDRISKEPKPKEHYSEEQIIKYSYSLLCSVDYLHQKRIAHRDIRPPNIMFDKYENLKLCDVGIARFVNEGEDQYTENRRVGALNYTAPEVMNQNRHLKKKDLFKSDAWSLGLVIAELSLKQLNIYDSRESLGNKESQLRKKIEELKGRYSEQLISLIFGLLDFNPEQRKSVQEAKGYLEENYPKFTEQQQKDNPRPIEEQLDSQERISQIERDLKRKFERDLEEAKIVLEERHSNLDEYRQREKQFVRPIEELEEFQEKISQIERDLKRKFEMNIENNFQFNNETGIFRVESLEESQIQSISKAMSDLKPKHLVIERTQNMTDNGVKDFTRFLGEKFSSLEHLSLNFDGNSNLTGSGVVGIGNNIGSYIKDLKHLSLSFNGISAMKNFGIEKLGEFIGSNIKCLHHLSLSFNGNLDIGDEGLNKLGHYIGSNLKVLSHLSLSFSENTLIGHQGIDDLAREIGSNIKGLCHLSLNFDGCRGNKADINDYTAETLGYYIGSNIKQLHHLSLSLKGSEKITDVGVDKLSRYIGENLRSLCHLSLSFDGDKNITDGSLKELAKYLGYHNKSLHYLNLSFNGNTKITDSGITTLGTSIKDNHEFLHHISLSFDGNLNISNVGVKGLTDAINTSERLKHLYHVSLSVDGNDKISKEAVQSFEKNFGRDPYFKPHVALKTKKFNLEGFKHFSKWLSQN